MRQNRRMVALDKRVWKTKENIKKTFFELSKSNGMQVKVAELCDKAYINKSTFYRHYRDIYDLAEELREDLVCEIMNKFENKNLLFSNPEAFLSDMKKVTDEYEGKIRLLFPELFDFINRLNTSLCEIYISDTTDRKDTVKMAFLIGGASYAFLTYPDDETDHIIAGYISAISGDSITPGSKISCLSH